MLDPGRSEYEDDVWGQEMDEIYGIMIDCPVADNHGRKHDRRRLEEEDLDLGGTKDLNSSHYEVTQMLYEQGHQYSIPHGSEHFYGLVAHRGILTEDEVEYIDWSGLAELAAEELGTTIQDIRRLYSAKSLLMKDRSCRDAIDFKLLQLQESGANMYQLALILGWPTRDGNCRKMRKVLARARRAMDHSS